MMVKAHDPLWSTAPLLQGTCWARLDSPVVYRVTSVAAELDGQAAETGGVMLTLEPTPNGRLVSCRPGTLRACFVPAEDPLGFWPYTPSRAELETLAGKHAVRGIVGHDELSRHGWRSVDQRQVEIGIPTWNSITLSAAACARDLWKDTHQTDVPAFNVPKTNDPTGNHQKNMYPPEMFGYIDQRLRHMHAFILRAVSAHISPTDITALTDDQVETTWKAIKDDKGLSDERRALFDRQRAVDRERISRFLAATHARSLGEPPPGVEFFYPLDKQVRTRLFALGAAGHHLLLRPEWVEQCLSHPEISLLLRAGAKRTARRSPNV